MVTFSNCLLYFAIIFLIDTSNYELAPTYSKIAQFGILKKDYLKVVLKEY